MLISKKAGTLVIDLGKDARGRGIMLSETASGDNLRPILEAEPIHEAWNISGKSLPEDITEGDGSKNGQYYLAYSFYLVNAGTETVDLLFQIKIQSTRSLDETIRVRVYYHDLEPKTYAKKTSDGTKEPDADESFEDSNFIYFLIGSFEPGLMNKVTIVLWVEGDDPDTTNDKIGGSVSLEAKFEIME